MRKKKHDRRGEDAAAEDLTIAKSSLELRKNSAAAGRSKAASTATLRDAEWFALFREREYRMREPQRRWERSAANRALWRRQDKRAIVIVWRIHGVFLPRVVLVDDPPPDDDDHLAALYREKKPLVYPTWPR
jgi:hypothetical protein